MRYLLIILALGLASIANAKQDYKITGPYTSKNLSIYLVHGKSRATGQKYITLGEAMKNKKVKVHETSNVNKLQIENISKKESVYIQAGDIIKGGKQDRVFSTDMVLEPESGKVDISAFCVEKGRWSQRGKESSKHFSYSNKQLSSKKLRLAARLKNSQSEVWKEVENAQNKISEKVGKSIKHNHSKTSLQLSLENKDVTRKIEDYKKQLSGIIDRKRDVIGYAFAINGELNTADVYANNSLFRKLWPKLLESASTEALSEYKKTIVYKVPEKSNIKKWFSDSKKGKKTTRKLNRVTSSRQIENSENVQFQTFGNGKRQLLIHETYIKKQ